MVADRHHDIFLFLNGKGEQTQDLSGVLRTFGGMIFLFAANIMQQTSGLDHPDPIVQGVGVVCSFHSDQCPGVDSDFDGMIQSVTEIVFQRFSCEPVQLVNDRIETKESLGKFDFLVKYGIK
jgi:hypothetical protein